MPNEHFISGIEGNAHYVLLGCLLHLSGNGCFPKHLEEAVSRYQMVKGDLRSKTTNGVGEFLGPSLFV